MQRPWCAAYWLALRDCSACFLIAHRTSKATVGWALPYYSSIKKMHHRPCRPIWWRHFLSWGSPSKMISLCQTNRKTASVWVFPSTSLKCDLSSLWLEHKGNLVSKSQILVKSHSQSLGSGCVHGHKFNMPIVLPLWAFLNKQPSLL